MSESPVDSVREFYRGRHVFFTGATGMLGTAYLSRLILDTPVERVYALVRGGESRLWATWGNSSPSDMLDALRTSEKLTVMEGDITRPAGGLSQADVKMIHDNVSIFIHGASTINLQKPLLEIGREVVNPSLALAGMALGCAKLTQFVYISTAYASTFLRQTTDGGLEGSDATIAENINQIRHDPSRSAEDELSDLNTLGSTPEYESVEFPFPYSYGKHLAERLILRRFHEAGLDKNVLIFRPSCIGPAESRPHAFYEIPGSSPGTTFFGALMALPPTKFTFSTTLTDPGAATLDETPVDMLVNRLIVHVARGSNGCVHAVAGIKGEQNIEAIIQAASEFRRSWWGRPELVWTHDHWKSDKQSALAKLSVILGSSFAFDESKTERIWDTMSEYEQSIWPLWPLRNLSLYESGIGRQEAAMAITDRIIARQYRLPKSFVRLFYKGATPSQKDDIAVCSLDRSSGISGERTSSKL
ncbi:male sterility protein-domain-containing protein [Ilyonectria robusta]|uniref:male sterility protein-domain-containing protein n=1 Tax=Ilyonectria robusta TaxID=1079257 RepID=UPI001E8E3A6A|nr:male sterility protein-domain-containing protein [Ilyonectria robusta]KAH8675176.1 male sterility protein-domain-containing protein [Ilyonectria robusta]